jgi:multidrug efflux system membrane fusion protein
MWLNNESVLLKNLSLAQRVVRTGQRRSHQAMECFKVPARSLRSPWQLSVLRIAIAAWLGGGILSLAGCSNRNVQPQAVVPMESAVPVTIATVTQKSMPVEVRAIGNVEAYSTVSVRAQIGGEVERAYFKEGQDVKKGDRLFTLDRRSYQAALQQLEANLARDQAQLENGRAQAERYTKLFQAGIVSKDQYDSFRTNADALAASVRADQAAIEKAKVDLDYCTVSSPLDGRTGSLLVHPGNVVKENDTVLVVINQIHPIYVTFSTPEQYLGEIKKYGGEAPLSVEAVIPQQELRPLEGRLSFVDNAVDTTTGTIKLKATFDNPESRLWPGVFVNVVLKLATRPNAVVVPSQAVQTGQSNQYVFVVKPDMTTELRTVVPGSTVEGETVIEKGVQPGEKVVTDGQLRLYPGAKVSIRTGSPPEGHPSAEATPQASSGDGAPYQTVRGGALQGGSPEKPESGS